MIPAPKQQAVFACTDLSIAYRNAEGRMTEVIKGVTLTLKPGGSLGIVGESGSGKSTLARALLGHLRPGSRFTGGRLDVLGTDMIGGDARAIAAMRRPADAAWPFFGFKIDCPYPGIVPVVQDRLLKCLDICAELKADQMVVHSPVTSWDHPNHAVFPEHKLWQIARATNLMKPVVARAAEYGVTLVLENVEDIDPAARVNLARELNAGKDTVKVSLDTGHALDAHKTTGAPPVDAYVSTAGAELRHIHLQDADGYADRHWHPGDGQLNWRALFPAIARLPQTPRLIIEVRDQAGVRRGVDDLRAAGLAS